MANFKYLSKVEVSSPVASVTFSSIPQTYTDLKVIWSSRGSGVYTGDYNYANFRLNGQTSTYATRYLIWDIGANAVVSYQGTSPLTGWSSADSLVGFSNGEAYLWSYKESIYKPGMTYSAVSNTSNNVFFNGFYGSVYQSNTALSSITIANVNGNYIQYSNFYLYGISNS